MLRLVTVLTAVLVAAMPATAAPSLNCAKATALSEKAICETWQLHWSDRQLSRLYTLARKDAAEAQRLGLIESQRRFLEERDRCGYAPWCIATLYHKRLKEVAVLVNVHDAYATFARGQTGDLRIARFGNAGAIEITTSGENGHECQFDADDLRQTGKGLLRHQANSGDEACRMTILPDGDDMRVEVEVGCRFYCGHRARIDGLYKRVP